MEPPVNPGRFNEWIGHGCPSVRGKKKRQRPSSRTIADYRLLLNVYVRPTLGEFSIQQLSEDDVGDLVEVLEKRETRGQKRGKGELPSTLSPRTIRLAITILGSALQWAVKKRWIHANPAADVNLPEGDAKEWQALSGPQAASFREQIQRDPYEAFFLFQLGAGTRPGEGLAIRWEDLDLDEGRAAIRRALTKVDGKPAFKPPKTKLSRRSIPLPPSLVAVLREHRKSQALHILKSKRPYDRSLDLVFANEVGQPLDSRNIVNRHFKPALQRAQLPSTIRLYDLRHTHATALLKAGVNPKVVSERLGHASTRITLDTYSHVLPGIQEEATRLIEESLFG